MAGPNEIHRMMRGISMESACYHAKAPRSITDYRQMSASGSRNSRPRNKDYTALEKVWWGFNDSVARMRGVDSRNLLRYLKEYACRQDRSPSQIRDMVYSKLIRLGI